MEIVIKNMVTRDFHGFFLYSAMQQSADLVY